MKDIFLVGLGGMVGCMGRYTISLLLGTRFSWPIGTAMANALGCLAIGLILSYLARQGNAALQLLFVTGFCGGFTTFSSFAFEGLQMLKAGHIGAYALYTGGSVLVGLLLCLAGWYLGSKVF